MPPLDCLSRMDTSCFKISNGSSVAKYIDGGECRRDRKFLLKYLRNFGKDLKITETHDVKFPRFQVSCEECVGNFNERIYLFRFWLRRFSIQFSRTSPSKVLVGISRLVIRSMPTTLNSIQCYQLPTILNFKNLYLHHIKCKIFTREIKDFFSQNKDTYILLYLSRNIMNYR